jgi:hypothetical protein
MNAPRTAVTAALALCATAGHAQTDADLAALERGYLACNRAALAQHLPSGHAGGCSEIYEQLLRQRFGGDFARLLQWSRQIDLVAANEAWPFDDAVAQYEAGHYAEAFRSFSRLADCGHREAAQIALRMRRFGPQLYGIAFETTPEQLARWSDTARAGSDTARGCAVVVGPVASQEQTRTGEHR